MTREEIKQKLKDLGLTQGDLCRKWNKPPVTISYLVNKKMTSKPLEKRLARLFGVTLDVLRAPGAGTGDNGQDQDH